jgi:hypothetical protein
MTSESHDSGRPRYAGAGGKGRPARSRRGRHVTLSYAGGGTSPTMDGTV